MSLEKINLRKLLQLFFADNRLQRSLLLAHIRKDRTKAKGNGDSGGGDFYGPFWADAKDHVAGRSSLPEQTEIRIAANATRAHLYPILRDCFLSMWNEKMRWRNEPFEFTPESVKAQLPIKELGAIVKIENTASIKTWDGSHRVIPVALGADSRDSQISETLNRCWLLNRSGIDGQGDRDHAAGFDGL